MSGTGMMTGMGWPGLLLMLLLWGGAIALILWGVSGPFPSGAVHAEADALAILRRRYARGEINREEFLQARETLRLDDSERAHHTHDGASRRA
jgi:putative membrane protein